MKQIWRLALNDLRLTVRDRPALIWLIAMPVAMMWFVGGIGGGTASDPRISLGIDNRDTGWLATALIDELTDEAIAMRVIDAAAPDAERPEPRTLIIPEGFTAGALDGEQQTLRLEKKPDSSAEFSLAAEVHVTRAIVRTLGRLVEMRDVGVSESLERFRAMGRREELVGLSVSTAGRGRAVPSGRAQSVPGTLTFIVLMMTLIYGGVFLATEKASGMLKRQAVLPMSRHSIFLGKLTGRFLIAAVQVVILVLAGRFLFGVSWGSSPLGLTLVLASFVFAVGALSTLLGALLRTPAQASSVGWIGSMVMAALGGCWWPGELMPGWMQKVAHAFPTAWAMDGFHSLISFGHGLPEVARPSLVLCAFGVAFAAFGARFLRFER
jgi:ABC-type multidrug transport system permease subunit